MQHNIEQTQCYFLFCSSKSYIGSAHIFDNPRRMTPHAVFMVTTRTILSLPGQSYLTLPKNHWNGGMLSCLTMTNVPT